MDCPLRKSGPPLSSFLSRRLDTQEKTWHSLWPYLQLLIDFQGPLHNIIKRSTNNNTGGKKTGFLSVQLRGHPLFLLNIQDFCSPPLSQLLKWVDYRNTSQDSSFVLFIRPYNFLMLTLRREILHYLRASVYIPSLPPEPFLTLPVLPANETFTYETTQLTKSQTDLLFGAQTKKLFHRLIQLTF